MSKRGCKNARRHVDKARNADISIAAWANAPFESGISISARCASLEEGLAHRAPPEDHAGQHPSTLELRNSVKTRGADLVPPTIVNGVSLVELHTHSIHSDGHLSPSALVQRAARRGVKVLALTDHDTMAGVREAMQAGLAQGVRVIPGVEISATSAARGKERGTGSDNVHILAYFGLGGPARWRDVEACLSRIREGRHIRAHQMVAKLSELGAPVRWQDVMKFAIGGGAPGRRHVAMALVEAGHVSSEREAFSLFIGDDGPAYASGAEPPAEEVVRLITAAGGVSVLAHPWTLARGKGGGTGCYHLLQRLHAVGLRGMEVYKEPRTDFQHFREWAEALGLLKLGGSDFHGRGGNEIDVGGCFLPPQAAWEFLVQSEQVWGQALRERMQRIARLGTPVDTSDGSRLQDEGNSVGCVNSDRSCEEGSLARGSSGDGVMESRRMLGDSVSWHKGENEGLGVSLDFVTDVEVLIVKEEAERLGLVWRSGQR